MNTFQRLCSGRLIHIPALAISLIGLGGFAANSPALFEDIPASKSGFTWIHENARGDKRYLPETLGPGGAFLDFDHDGWMDIYRANYGPSDFYTPPKPLQSALYRNNQNGSFTDVTAKAGELRHIPMNQVVIEALQSLPRMHHNPFVFFGREGWPLHNGIKHADWKKVLKTAGIKNLRWHDLGHRFASRLVMRGVDRYTVSKLMGHHSTETTVRYAHRGPNYPKESANALVSDEENGTRTGTSQTTLSVNHYGPVAQKDRGAVS